MKGALLLIVVILLAMGVTSTAMAIMEPTAAAMPELSERDALMALYNSTDGPN